MFIFWGTTVKPHYNVKRWPRKSDDSFPDLTPAPAVDDKIAKVENLIKKAAAKILAESEELSLSIEKAKIADADPEIAKLLQKAWESLKGPEISEEEALRMLAVGRKGILDEFVAHPKALGRRN